VGGLHGTVVCSHHVVEWRVMDRWHLGSRWRGRNGSGVGVSGILANYRVPTLIPADAREPRRSRKAHPAPALGTRLPHEMGKIANRVMPQSPHLQPAPGSN